MILSSFAENVRSYLKFLFLLCKKGYIDIIQQYVQRGIQQFCTLSKN